MIKNDYLRASSKNWFCRKFTRFWGKNLDWNFHPCKKIDIFHVCNCGISSALYSVHSPSPKTVQLYKLCNTRPRSSASLLRNWAQLRKLVTQLNVLCSIKTAWKLSVPPPMCSLCTSFLKGECNQLICTLCVLWSLLLPSRETSLPES